MLVLPHTKFSIASGQSNYERATVQKTYKIQYIILQSKYNDTVLSYIRFISSLMITVASARPGCCCSIIYSRGRASKRSTV